MDKETFDRLRDQAHQAAAEEQADAMEAERITSLDFILNNMKAWQYWYLKRNQWYNYFRLIRYIPPGMEENPNAWHCRFQIWAKNRLAYDFRVHNDTVMYFARTEHWNKAEDTGDRQVYVRTPYNPAK